jgi:hypothetical protein
MTWRPNRRRPCLGDYHDVSPPILDWVSGEYRAPRHNDNTKLETIAARVIRQCAATARAAKRAKGKKP